MNISRHSNLHITKFRKIHCGILESSAYWNQLKQKQKDSDEFLG